MASRRRVVEEKNLKTLRELAALPANKQCFDCYQRGPTYINMTIGSFVCTSCSGILRGLTPPHRVKSITMTTFTPEEIEFLKSRGNEYCRCVWLGTYDSRTSNMEIEGKDEHRKRDLMVQKYEKKRWYVDPEIAIKKMQRDHMNQKNEYAKSTTSQLKQYNHVPEVKPISQLLGRTPTALIVENNTNNNNQALESWPHPVSSATAQHTVSAKTTSQSQPAQSIDLLFEFVGDSFVSSPSGQGTSAANGNFANFECAFSTSEESANTKTSTMTMPASVSLDAYSAYTQQTTKETAFSPPARTTSSTATMSANTIQSNADRYAALADLDNLFHQPASVTSPSWSVESSVITTTTSTLDFSSSTACVSNVFTTAPSNPFTSNSISWNQPASQGLFSSVNPFQNQPAESCLPFQQPQMNRTFAPLPVVGNSPSDDSVRSQFSVANSVTAFAPVNSIGITSPPNGFHSQHSMQNGEFVTSPTSNTMWGIPGASVSSTWPANQLVQNVVPTVNKQNVESQHSGWIQNAANPFMVGSGSFGAPVTQRPSPNNPFL